MENHSYALNLLYQKEISRTALEPLGSLLFLNVIGQGLSLSFCWMDKKSVEMRTFGCLSLPHEWVSTRV